jgi:hypothetical protein
MGSLPSSPRPAPYRLPRTERSKLIIYSDARHPPPFLHPCNGTCELLITPREDEC